MVYLTKIFEMQGLFRIILVIFTCLTIGYLSGIQTRESIETWYLTLEKPVFNPPNWVFAPVWTVLYALMGVAAGRVWNRMHLDEKEVKKGFSFFVIQLALNVLWSFIFFSMHNPFLALIEIFLLWLMIYETYISFKKVDAVSGKLLIPYLAWVAFAGVLNGSIWWLNK